MKAWRSIIALVTVVGISLFYASPSYAAFKSKTPNVFTLMKSLGAPANQIVFDASGDAFVLEKGKIVELSSSGQITRTIKVSAMSIAVTSDGSTVYAAEKDNDGQNDNQVAIIDVASGTTSDAIVDNSLNGTQIIGLFLSLGNQELYVVEPRQVESFSTQTGNLDNTIQVTDSMFSGYDVSASPSISPDGNDILVPYDNGQVADFNIATQTQTTITLNADDYGSVSSAVYGPNEQYWTSTYSSGTYDEQLYSIDQNSWSVTSSDMKLPDMASPVLAASGQYLFVSPRLGTIEAVDPTAGKIVATISLRAEYYIRLLEFSQTTNILYAVADNDLYMIRIH